MPCFASPAVAASLVLGLAAAAPPGYMNPVDYRIANPGTPGARPHFRGKFFEVYGPEVKTRYSEVYWKSTLVPLPEDIVRRFDGRVMAITGFESDVVRRGADGSDESAPCHELYNHHYSSYMHGKKATLLEAPRELGPGEAPAAPMAMDGHHITEPRWRFEGSPEDPGFPSVQVFSEGNGNEHRGSFKGAPKGLAQLIDSPVAFLSGPMVINTNKRLTNDTSPGPINNRLLPRNSLAPPGADYSGLVECPCTSRKPKIMDNYTVDACKVEGPPCAALVESPDECAAAWAKAGEKGRAEKVALVRRDDLPPGCSAGWVPSSGAWALTFNFGGRRSTPGRKCVCRDPKCLSGTLAGTRFDGLARYCAPYPRSELITTGNAICDIRTYKGGQLCCSGGTLLLDADQEVPAAEDTWRMKYRFYFEDYNGQLNTFRVFWSTEATNNEYDVPRSKANCIDPATPKAACEHTLHSKFRGVDLLALGRGCMSGADLNACGNVTRIRERDGGRFRLVYAGPHCHAPACKSMELWDDDTGELLCNASAVFPGPAGCNMEIPPCLWGSAAEGLKPPPVLRLDSNLTVVKRANSTYGHWGTMALWQMHATYLDGGDEGFAVHV